MAEVLLVFQDRLSGPDGSQFGARVCGRELTRGQWEGWIEFAPLAGASSGNASPVGPDGDGAPAVCTARETLQLSRRDLLYWATGLTHTFLEGALARALGSGRRERLSRGPGPGKPARARPGRPAAAAEREVRPGRAGVRVAPAMASAVLDPFDVFAQGEELLRQELGALSPPHLRAIARTFDLTARTPEELARLSAAELRGEILAAVRARFRGDDGTASPSAFLAPAE